jgi:hypothetical protein
MVTPTKQGITVFPPQNSRIVEASERLKSHLSNMTTDEIKQKLKKSTKFADLKTPLNNLRMDQLEQKRLQAEELKMKRLFNQNPGPADHLPKFKAFKNIELEIIR